MATHKHVQRCPSHAQACDSMHKVRTNMQVLICEISHHTVDRSEGTQTAGFHQHRAWVLRKL